MNQVSKSCTLCLVELPIAAFYKQSGRNDYRGQCRKCYSSHAYTQAKDYQTTYRQTHPEWNKAKHLKIAYGITLADYKALLHKQNSVCAICKCTESRLFNGKPVELAVDHNHSTGQIRGLLCTRCNRGVGIFKDDISRLESAIQYLQKPTPA